MTAENMSDEYTPNRQERLRAAKKQKEARAKITKDQLWKAIGELRTALGQEVRGRRDTEKTLEETRGVLAVLLAREEGHETTLMSDEFAALSGLRRIVFTPTDDEDAIRVQLVEVVLDDDLEDTEELEYDFEGEEE